MRGRTAAFELDRDESAWRIRGASLSWRFPGMVDLSRRLSYKRAPTSAVPDVDVENALCLWSRLVGVPRTLKGIQTE